MVTIAVKDAAHVPNPCVYEVGGYEHDWMRFCSDTHCDSRVIGCASAVHVGWIRFVFYIVTRRVPTQVRRRAMNTRLEDFIEKAWNDT